MPRERGPFEPPAGYPADRRWPYVSAVVKAAMAGVITEDQAVDKVLGFWSSAPPRSDWSSVAGLVGWDEARETVRRAFTPAEQRDGIWQMTHTEFKAELAKAWDEGANHGIYRSSRDQAVLFDVDNPHRAAG